MTFNTKDREFTQCVASIFNLDNPCDCFLVVAGSDRFAIGLHSQNGAEWLLALEFGFDVRATIVRDYTLDTVRTKREFVDCNEADAKQIIAAYDVVRLRQLPLSGRIH